MSIGGREYWRCGVCGTTQMEEAGLPGPVAERNSYSLKSNNPQDAGYRQFLSKLTGPLLARLSPAQEGLDYGSGTGSALAQMMTVAGHRMRLYDPFFHPDLAALERTFDFVTCTEVVEHFHRPAEEFVRLDKLVRPGGWLAIMTCFQTEDDRFANWHYRRDLTHVTFYKESTFRCLAQKFGWHCDIPVKDVVLMQRPNHNR